MRYLTLALFTLFTLFCIIVAVANRTAVSFSLYPLPFQWDLPLFALLFIGIFIGLGAGFGVVLLKSIKQARLTRQQNKKIRDLEQQVKNLTPAEKPETLPEA
ncbi:LapA family protein [Paremcibacter congregatus]|uniref:Lipopolysaccharide assembly protein A domain-containing protein n=1 Tax=Paremcibacter congregatus TaxID=2043170 RepID=A0A2G4YR62_9PROT|nr:LapA family protein [Paremcibacter congregatus]PHZ83946.1 hypothetical protein CRD36_14120 [Paremcibacter congregatus]QDE25964.1 LapA family protein [Paremcibacter congregatus]